MKTKNPQHFCRGFLFVTLCVQQGFPLNHKISNAESGVELRAFAEELLTIAGKYSLTRAEGLGIEHDWRLGKRHVRAVEVTTVHVRVTLVTHEDLSRREQRILVESPTVVHGADILDAERRCEAFRGGRSETSGGCLEDRGNFGAGDEPVAAAAERLAMHHVADFDDLDVERLILFLDGITKGGIEVPRGDCARVVAEVAENFTVDLEVDLLSQNGCELGLGVEVVLTAEVLLGLVAPHGLQLAGLGGDLFRLNNEVDFGEVLVAFHVVLVRDGNMVGTRVAVPSQAHLACGQVQRGAGDLGRGRSDVVERERAAFRDHEGLDGDVTVIDGAGHGSGENRGVLKRHAGAGAAGVCGTRLVLNELVRVVDAQVGIAAGELLERVGVVCGEAALGGSTDAALVAAVSKTEVIDEAGRAEQRLNRDHLVGDQLGVNSTDERNRDPLELGDVARVGRVLVDETLVFEENGSARTCVLVAYVL
jgi:hypothetical protein